MVRMANKSKGGQDKRHLREIRASGEERGGSGCPDISKHKMAHGGRGRSSIALTSASRPAVLPLRDPMTRDTLVRREKRGRFHHSMVPRGRRYRYNANVCSASVLPREVGSTSHSASEVVKGQEIYFTRTVNSSRGNFSGYENSTKRFVVE